MLMVIFGAGASFDSVSTKDWTYQHDVHGEHRPPLAKELFAVRAPFGVAIDQFPTAAPLIGELRIELTKGGAIEAVLQRFVSLADSGDPQLQRQMMALRFYLQRILSECGRLWAAYSNGVTNYAVLMNKIERWRQRSDDQVLLVTFNYDTMLENGLELATSFNPQHIDGFVDDRPYKIFRLHGSVTWGRVTDLEEPGASPSRLIEFAPNVALSDQYSLGQTTSTGFAVVPAIAIPTESKRTFECPSHHVDTLRAMLSSVDRVLVVGWRGQEEHFLALCREHLPREVEGLVVSSNQQGATETVLRMKEGRSDLGLYPSSLQGFSDLLSGDETLASVLNRTLS